MPNPPSVNTRASIRELFDKINKIASQNFLNFGKPQVLLDEKTKHELRSMVEVACNDLAELYGKYKLYKKIRNLPEDPNKFMLDIFRIAQGKPAEIWGVRDADFIVSQVFADFSMSTSLLTLKNLFSFQNKDLFMHLYEQQEKRYQDLILGIDNSSVKPAPPAPPAPPVEPAKPAKEITANTAPKATSFITFNFDNFKSAPDLPETETQTQQDIKNSLISLYDEIKTVNPEKEALKTMNIFIHHCRAGNEAEARKYLQARLGEKYDAVNLNAGIPINILVNTSRNQDKFFSALDLTKLLTDVRAEKSGPKPG